MNETGISKSRWITHIPPAQFRIHFDEMKCWWCRSCELACSLKHEGVCSPTLSRIRIFIDHFQATVQDRVCRQCAFPECFAACPTPKAVKIHPRTGARIIDPQYCTGCGSCAQACPWNQKGTIIARKPREAKEEGKTPWIYFKCDLCDGEPICVDVCPTEALTLRSIGVRGSKSP